MRNLGVFLLSALLTLSAALPAFAEPLYLTAALAESTEHDMPYEEALEIARGEWQKAVGAIDDPLVKGEFPERYAVSSFVTVKVEGKAERAWRITLWDRVTGESCAVTILSPSGKVAEVDAFQIAERYEELIEAKGPPDFWSLEDGMLYDRMFIQSPWDSARRGLPGEGDMPREEAIIKSREIVLSRSDITGENLDALTRCVAFWECEPQEGLDVYDTDYWTILYGTGGPDAGKPFHLLYAVNLSAVDARVFYYYDEAKDGPLNG